MTARTITTPTQTFTSCDCVAQTWPILVDLLILLGRPEPRVSQGSYRLPSRKSGRTHVGGGVLDLDTIAAWLDDLLELMGWASYIRTAADRFTPHTHAVLIGCPHLDPQAAAQVADWYARRNGLASHLADRDTTRPTTPRNWEAGRAWALTEINRRQDTADMQLTDLIQNPYTLKGEIPVSRALRDAPRYANKARSEARAARAEAQATRAAVTALAGAFAAYVALEAGSDAAITAQVTGVVQRLEAISAALDAMPVDGADDDEPVSA